MLRSLAVEEWIVVVSPAVVVAAVLAERVHIRLSTGRFRLGELTVAVGLLAGSLVAGTWLGPTVQVLWARVGDHAPAVVATLVTSNAALEYGVVFVAWDLAGFAQHWLGHRTRTGWLAHRPHHTGTHYDLSLAFRQSWAPWPALVTFPLVALTGGSFETAVVCAAISTGWQGLLHTGLRVPTPNSVELLVMTPATHRLHHASRRPVNLGPVLTVWDQMAGTFARPGFAPEASRGLDYPIPIPAIHGG